MFVWKHWRKLRALMESNQSRADAWVAQQLGEPIHLMPDGPYRNRWLGEVPLIELKRALLRIDPTTDPALYDDLQSWIAVREHFSSTSSVTFTLTEDFSEFRKK